MNEDSIRFDSIRRHTMASTSGRGASAIAASASAMDFLRHTRPDFPAGLEVRRATRDGWTGRISYPIIGDARENGTARDDRWERRARRLTRCVCAFVPTQVVLVSEENAQRRAAAKMLEAASYRGARGRATTRRPRRDRWAR